MTLIEFLLARIAEDEEAARAATPGPLYWDEVSGLRTRSEEKRHNWQDVWGESGQEDYTTLHGGGYDTGEIVGDEGQKAHIVRWDRDRVLRECEAKRRIVDHASQCDEAPIGGWCYSCHVALCALASVYIDHPDFQEEWRP